MCENYQGGQTPNTHIQLVSLPNTGIKNGAENGRPAGIFRWAKISRLKQFPSGISWGDRIGQSQQFNEQTPQIPSGRDLTNIRVN